MEVVCCEFIPKLLGGLLAVATADGQVALYVKNRRLERWIEQTSWRRASATLSMSWWPQFDRLFCGHRDGAITAWRLRLDDDGAGGAAATSQRRGGPGPSGRLGSAAGGGAADGQPAARTPDRDGPVAPASIAASAQAQNASNASHPAGRAPGSEERRELAAEMRRHVRPVTHLRLLKEYNCLLSASPDGSILCWDLFGYSYRGEFKGHRRRITGLEYSPPEQGPRLHGLRGRRDRHRTSPRARRFSGSRATASPFRRSRSRASRERSSP